MLTTEQFGKALRDLRVERGISQRQLAELMTVSKPTIANWEAGKRLPDLTMLFRLAECLGVESYVLLDALREPDEPPKIIVVEDMPVILKGTVRTIREAIPDAEVCGFRTGAEALRYAAANRVSAAFLDVELSGENGIDLARSLKELRGRTNIIYLTCHPNYVREAVETYCSGYILKPLTPEKLRREIANLRFPVRGLGT
ncbi:MAG: response regulator [Oscillibacter sp.]|nr:response regulator [Oscillibacter sp.]